MAQIFSKVIRITANIELTPFEVDMYKKLLNYKSAWQD